MSTQINPKPGKQRYSYEAALAASEQVNWKVEDLIGGDRKLDFSRPFLPETLVRVEGLSFLSPAEQLTLNQIRGRDYLHMFGLVEEFILPFVLDHARPQLPDDDFRTRAFLQFASEEAKHIHLFKRFREEFEAGFGHEVKVIGPPQEIADAVLAHSKLAVAFVILHIEWMTQRHYVDSVKDNQDLDPQFKSLLRHHWMEEAQHAKLDTLMVEQLAEGMSEQQILDAVEEYLQIGGMLDDGLRQQMLFDLEAFERATGRELAENERRKAQAVQQQALRWTFLGTGMTHPEFLGTLERLSPTARKRIEQVSAHFC